jgi:hypothetical protein
MCFAMVKLWSPSTWEMTPTMHICIPKTSTMNDFSLILAQKFPQITELKSLQMCKIASSWNFNRVSLPSEQWHNLFENENYMQSKPIFMSTDGLLFVVKNADEPLREMTEDEHIRFNTAQFEMNIQGSELPIQVTTGGNKRRTGAPEQGIKIVVTKKVQE